MKVSVAIILGINSKVSIPEGAIEGMFFWAGRCGISWFQYPKVRLKDWHCKNRGKHRRVSIPEGAIEGKRVHLKALK